MREKKEKNGKAKRDRTWVASLASWSFDPDKRKNVFNYFAHDFKDIASVLKIRACVYGPAWTRAQFFSLLSEKKPPA